MKNPFQSKLRLGELLLRSGFITAEQVMEGLAIQKEWGTRLGDIVLAKGWVRAFDFYRTLADHYQLPFVDMIKESPDETLLNSAEVLNYTTKLVMPWKKRDGRVIVAVANPGEEAVQYAAEQFGENVDFVITSKFDIIWNVQRFASDHLTQGAVNKLLEQYPEQSARQVFTGRQLIEIGVLAAVSFFSLVMWPVNTIIGLNLFIALFFLANFFFRATLTWVGADKKLEIKVTDEMVRALDEHSLPVYTVLVPLFKEHGTLPILAAALRRLDYPFAKLDVKLILEEEDAETIQAAKDLGLEGVFEILRVPHSIPQTKPKACNYALNFARGEYVTIFDAEDKPDPDQLKKAVISFRNAPEEVVCIQARLNYFNANQNWLTRMFTLEYSIWFDYYLPALDKLGIPIPLGGTSNHFKTTVLRSVDAWDPYNVTEDCDLGVRLTQLGYCVATLNSTTYEEANSQFYNWIRQRSRWVKGYMQTYLVHMRKPKELYQRMGHVGFWGFQMFIGGNILSNLILPVMYGMFVFWMITGTMVLDQFFPPWVLYISLFNLLIGNGVFVYVYMLGAFKRHNYSLIPYALTTPFYWLIMSIASYKALWQLIFNPFYWEKTVHGLTEFEHHDLGLVEQKNA